VAPQTRSSKVELESRGVQSVEVGGRLLEVLVAAASPMMLRDLAARADLLPGQAHVYLTSFKKLGFVEQDRASGQYRIGPFAMRLALARLHSDTLLQAGSDAAADLSRELGVSVTVTVWGSGAPTVILVREGPDEININLRPGRIFGVTSTATGRLFAAFRMGKDVEARISHEISSREQGADKEKAFLVSFRAAIAAAKKAGYTVAAGMPLPTINAIAAPVFDAAGTMQFALTIIGRASTLNIGFDARPLQVLQSRIDQITGATKMTARRRASS
jgi:DNA-binding IclR family transcriptional regulator